MTQELMTGEWKAREWATGERATGEWATGELATGEWATGRVRMIIQSLIMKLAAEKITGY